MRTALGKVRGLGSAKEGTGEFIAQRVTSVALAFLTVYFLILVLSLYGAPYEEVRAAIAFLPNAALLVAGLLLTTVHMRIGMQVIVEDYVHSELPKLALLIANWLFSWGVGLLASFAVLKIAFGA